MRDDQRPERDKPEDQDLDDAFDDALDDLFGLEDDEADSASEEPEIPSEPPPPRPDPPPISQQRPPTPSQSPPPPPQSQPTAPPPSPDTGRSSGVPWLRIAGIGCLSLVACCVVLLIIGLILPDTDGESGDTSDSADDEPIEVIATVGSDRAAATIEYEGTPGIGLSEQPIPVGAEGPLGDGWVLRVDGVIPDAGTLILAENMFNDPADEGNQFFMATVTATNLGDETAEFDGDFRLRVVGQATDTIYPTIDEATRCGVIPNDLPVEAVPVGGSTSGNVCWQIDSRDAGDLLLFSHHFDDDEFEIWFSLAPKNIN